MHTLFLDPHVEPPTIIAAIHTQLSSRRGEPRGEDIGQSTGQFIGRKTHAASRRPTYHVMSHQRLQLALGARSSLAVEMKVSCSIRQAHRERTLVPLFGRARARPSLGTTLIPSPTSQTPDSETSIQVYNGFMIGTARRLPGLPACLLTLPCCAVAEGGRMSSPTTLTLPLQVHPFSAHITYVGVYHDVPFASRHPLIDVYYLWGREPYLTKETFLLSRKKKETRLPNNDR